MREDFISVQDRIISSAIDLISEAGLGSLSFDNISMRINLSGAMIYKYYSDTNELLVDVVKTYFKFDHGIFRTISSKEGTYLEKINMYVDAYSSYYESYYTLSTLALQYEELLHNTYTRDIVLEGFKNRMQFLKELFQGAIDNHEIAEGFSSSELANALSGIAMMFKLDRRVNYRKGQYKAQVMGYISRWIDFLKVEVKDEGINS